MSLHAQRGNDAQCFIPRGKIYGQLNAKWLYIGTITLFEVGSAICGASRKMDALIFGRALAGVGGAGMYVGAMTLLSVTTTMQERPMYIGMTGLTWGAGTVLGPVIGGAFADNIHTTWRWAFYINLVIGGTFAPVCLFLLPSFDPRPGVSYRKRLSEIDFLGAILIIGATASGVMALNFGGLTWPWNSGKIIGLFCISGVLFILFGLQQVYTVLTNTEQRLFPVHFLKSRTMLILFTVTASAGTAVFLPVYFIPLFFQFVKQETPLEAAIRLLPFICLLVFAVLVNGTLLSKYGFYMPWYLVGGILILTGGALMYTVDQTTGTSEIYGYSILIGIGTGCFVQASFSVAQAKVDQTAVSSVVGFISFSQFVGITISLAIANTVFLNEAARKISVILPTASASEVKAAIAGVGSTFFNTLSPDVRQSVLHAIALSTDKAYILVITAGALTVALVPFMKWETIHLANGDAS
jgi:MFS family permease